MLHNLSHKEYCEFGHSKLIWRTKCGEVRLCHGRYSVNMCHFQAFTQSWKAKLRGASRLLSATPYLFVTCAVALLSEILYDCNPGENLYPSSRCESADKHWKLRKLGMRLVCVRETACVHMFSLHRRVYTWTSLWRYQMHPDSIAHTREPWELLHPWLPGGTAMCTAVGLQALHRNKDQTRH